MLDSPRHFLDNMFHPSSIAIVGASTSDTETGWVKRLLNFGYKGEIYPINPKAAEINGLKAYPSVKDVPYPVEYVIFNIPARYTLQAMNDCIDRGVKYVHCFAAGFSETGLDDAKLLEKQLLALAKSSGIRLLGPNCMGLYCPAAGLTFNPDFPRESGSIAFVSQSGAEAMRLVFLGQDSDLFFSKVASYGNAADLDAPDFLEYLADDDETKAIACYIEGVKNGPRFIAAVKKCLAKKPVVILKAGLTESGAGAAASHTASLTGAKTVWEAFFKQTGAISANTMDEVADILQALLRVKPTRGRRAAVVGRGGGIGVIAADICERAGFKVPVFSKETRQRLLEVIPEAGASIRNPVETTAGLGGASVFYRKGLPIVDEDTETDIILIHIAVDVYGTHTPDLAQKVGEAADALAEKAPSLRKPMAAAMFTGGHPDTMLAVHAARQKLINAGVAVFNGVESATRAINKIVSYYSLERN